MKIVEGLKKLRLIEKKMKSNSESITKYASQVSTERPIFDSEKDQRDQVSSLIQANNDLFEEYLKLKDRLDRTNNEVIVTIGSEKRTINQFLNIHRKLGKLLINTFESLNDKSGEMKLHNYRGENAQIVRYYDEKFKNQKLQYWNELIGEISGSLEVINATTNVIE